ncbi:hypothetical protein G6F50_018561 [Rhizopus delemar]|uniref:Uncharacterized protein n=1 Tax=Rhizopus delemar TaxID=936053 RepID=A0A9P6XLU4_9FUNG|nr:hypothetical protein G6F50_018561 [Rhizopus delemar]
MPILFSRLSELSMSAPGRHARQCAYSVMVGWSSIWKNKARGPRKSDPSRYSNAAPWPGAASCPKCSTRYITPPMR